MCRTTEIRYVHTMRHPGYPGELRCGCVCAGAMEGDYVGAKRREKTVLSRAKRRETWAQPPGSFTASGNPTRTLKGRKCVAIERPEGGWRGWIVNRETDRTFSLPGPYATAEAAMLAMLREFERRGLV